MSWCKTCQRVGQRVTAGNRRRGKPFKPAYVAGAYKKGKLAPSVRNSRRRRHYRDKRDPRLPFEPFQQWLLARINESSVNAVAKTVGMSWKRVANMRDGWEYNSKQKGWYSILHIRLSTVEKFTRAYDIQPTLIYDRYVIEHYKAELYTQRTLR